MTHTELQQMVVDLAKLLGWEHLHVRRTIGKGRKWTTSTNLVGWPDLMLMRPPDGLLFVELKVPPDKPSDEQAGLLEYLDRFAHASATVWTPADLDSGRIQAELQHPEATYTRT